MIGLPRLAARALFIVLIAYLVIGGATLTGMLVPSYKFVTLLLLLPALVGWLYIRWRQNWQWHRTAFDSVTVLWIAAIALAFAANTESWRRMAIGLWYVGVYIVAWYTLQDILANTGLPRAFLVDALLIAGVLVLLDGYIELVGLVQRWLDTPPEMRVEFYNTVRVWGRLGNPNWLATFTIFVVPLGLARALTARGRVIRVLALLYSALLGVLGFFTFSRAGWIGLGAMLVTLAGLALFTWQRAIQDGARRWLSRLPGNRGRLVRIAVGVLALLVVGSSVLILARISETGGRSLDDRIYLYDTALQLFAEKPLTGHGLFTFGAGVMRLNSVPYRQAHGSAHNLFLNIAAELGVIGLVALAATAIALVWAIRRVWRSGVDRHTHILLTGGVAAVAGVAAQSFFDFTLTTPALTLVCLIVLVVLTAQEQAIPVRRARQMLQVGAVLALCAGLIVTAVWSNAAYHRYLAALSEAVQADARSENYVRAAQVMQSAVDADPAMPVYSLYQGMFYALAAQRDEATSAPDAIQAYERFLQMEPHFAPAWANLWWLYEATGQPEKALDAAQQAVANAPKAIPLYMNLGQLYEARGQMDEARAVYRQALETTPDSVFYPFWEETPLRREIASAPEVIAKLSEKAQVLRLIIAGQSQAARARLNAADRIQIDPLTRVLFETYLTTTPEEEAHLYRLFAKLAAHESFANVDIEALTLVGRAATACALGKIDEAQAALARIEKLRASVPFLDADATIGFFVQMQFFRIGVPPFFLPGDAWPVLGPFTEQLLRLHQDRYPDCRAE